MIERCCVQRGYPWPFWLSITINSSVEWPGHKIFTVKVEGLNTLQSREYFSLGIKIYPHCLMPQHCTLANSWLLLLPEKQHRLSLWTNKGLFLSFFLYLFINIQLQNFICRRPCFELSRITIR